MRVIAAVVVSIVVMMGAGWAGAQETAAGGEAKKGAFETKFAQRSPLSALAEMTRRLGKEGMETDYDLATKMFSVYVPENYDPAQKYGVLALANYKDWSGVPVTVVKQFDDLKLIYVMLGTRGAPGAGRCGPLLDAVFNLEKEYSIDEKRVYIFDFDDHLAGERLFFGYPDVFTGAALFWNFKYFKPVRAPNGGAYPPELPAVDLTRYSAAKAHPLALVKASDQNDEWNNSFRKALLSDGWKNVQLMPVTLEQAHYPNYTTDWVPNVIAYLDEHRTAAALAAGSGQKVAGSGPTTEPTTGPVTARATAHPAPAGDPAQGLFSMAKSLAAAGKYEQARTRLNAIVEKYPDSPVVKDAQALLEEIKGK